MASKNGKSNKTLQAEAAAEAAKAAAALEAARAETAKAESAARTREAELAAAEKVRAEDAAAKAAQNSTAEKVRQALTVFAPLVAGLVIGKKKADQIAEAAAAAAKVTNRNLTAVANVINGLKPSAATVHQPLISSMDKLKAAVIAADRLKLGNIKGPRGLAVAGFALAEMAVARIMAANTDNDTVKETLNAVGYVGAGVAAGVVATRSLQISTSPLLATSRNVIAVEAARQAVNGGRTLASKAMQVAKVLGLGTVAGLAAKLLSAPAQAAVAAGVQVKDSLDQGQGAGETAARAVIAAGTLGLAPQDAIKFDPAGNASAGIGGSRSARPSAANAVATAVAIGGVAAAVVGAKKMAQGQWLKGGAVLTAGVVAQVAGLATKARAEPAAVSEPESKPKRGMDGMGVFNTVIGVGGLVAGTITKSKLTIAVGAGNLALAAIGSQAEAAGTEAPIEAAPAPAPQAKMSADRLSLARADAARTAAAMNTTQVHIGPRAASATPQSKSKGRGAGRQAAVQPGPDGFADSYFAKRGNQIVEVAGYHITPRRG